MNVVHPKMKEVSVGDLVCLDEVPYLASTNGEGLFLLNLHNPVVTVGKIYLKSVREDGDKFLQELIRNFEDVALYPSNLFDLKIVPKQL